MKEEFKRNVKQNNIKRRRKRYFSLIVRFRRLPCRINARRKIIIWREVNEARKAMPIYIIVTLLLR